jgi:hypothetical protein
VTFFREKLEFGNAQIARLELPWAVIGTGDTGAVTTALGPQG